MPNLEQTESITTTDENLNAAFKMFSDAYSKGAVNTIKEHPVESVVTSTAIGAAIAGAAVLFLTRGRGLLPMAEREAGAMLQTGMNTGERLAVGATRSYAGAALREAPERALVNDVAHPELLK
ncbi:MAG: hypothetical protein JSS83_21795, partial [Cyanobacteria bacterium SZAS LIN-3]|nr:hypothetical protein [Cyanobacteria bacterium SZAS LIN-3]